MQQINNEEKEIRTLSRGAITLSKRATESITRHKNVINEKYPSALPLKGIRQMAIMEYALLRLTESDYAEIVKAQLAQPLDPFTKIRFEKYPHLSDDAFAELLGGLGESSGGVL